MPPSSLLLAGRYRLAGELGRGGMGVVWAAHDELLQRDVAVKEVHFPPSLAQEDVERLSGRTLREARAVAAVDTPSVVRVFDIIEQDGRPWIVMELLRGRTLAEAVAQDGPLPHPEVARIGLALVDALEASHAAGILHRDVKPGNVLLVDTGRVALTDFGIATAAGEDHPTTGVVLGSPAYVAPERFQGQAPAEASDYWALGATLWTAAEGRPPYEGTDSYAVVSAVANNEPPSLTQGGAGLRDLLRAVMDRDPARRPGPVQIKSGLERVLVEPGAPPEPTAVLPQHLVEDFDRTTVLRAAAPVAPPRPRPVASPPPLRTTPGEPGNRRRLPLAVAGLGLLALLGGGLVALNHDGSRTAGATADPKTSAAPVDSVTASAPPSSKAASPSSASAAAGSGTYTDPTLGWRVDVPQGWTRRSSDAGTRFTDPATGRYVLIGTRYPAGPSAVGAWRDSERSFRKSHSGYERVRLETIEGSTARGAQDAADWEFRYEDGGRALHALDRALVFGKRGYAVYVQAPEDMWGASQQLFEDVQASFRPTS